MDIQWYGHDCFKIKGPDLTIVTDPFDDSLGYSPGPLQANVITMSHLGPHSAHEERVTEARRILRGPGEYELSGVLIMGVRTYCDTSKGSERGLNTVFRIAVDHLAICHLGAIGHSLTPDNVSAIGDVDILMVPIGGGETLSPGAASETVGLLEPKVVIPMHYRTPRTTADLEPIEPFLKELGVTEFQSLPRFTSSGPNLPAGPQVVLLQYEE